MSEFQMTAKIMQENALLLGEIYTAGNNFTRLPACFNYCVQLILPVALAIEVASVKNIRGLTVDTLVTGIALAVFPLTL